ncbi:hypothetical protein BH09BAC1_BH09BAC1_26890 [soil metagenome]
MAIIPGIENWLKEVLATPEPPEEIIAYWFGLFETKQFFVLYVIGSPEFDEDDNDWTYEIGYEPANKYFHLNAPEWKGLEWEQVLEKVKAHLQNSPALKEGRFAKAEAIAVGFDDGDVIRVR